MNVPTFREIRRFLQIDGWEAVEGGEAGRARSGHDHFRKLLPDGTLLRTHVSRAADKGPGPDRFALILRDQLRVSAEAFWEALRTGKPVPRPTPEPPAPARGIPNWVVAGLRKQGYSAEAIAAFTAGEAEAELRGIWGRGR